MSRKPSTKEKTPKEKLVESLGQPIYAYIESEGITKEYLAKKLKQELEATEVKVFSGKDGVVYSEELIAWKVRQEARKDAHSLLNHYPAQEVKHTGDLKINLVNYGSKPDNPS